MIQIIGGEFRSRRLKSPKNFTTRPTTAQVRQAVFNICQNEIEGASFLDICAGSGSMGIEALSRGAKHSCFIDHDRYALIAIRENLKLLELEARTDVIVGDAEQALKRLEKQNRTFQIIYFDPPYSKENALNQFVVDILLFLDKSSLLAPQGIFFLEESAYFQLESLTLTTLTLQSKRRFGESYLFCFNRS